MLGTLWRRLWYLLNRRRFEQELTQEMREHMDDMADPAVFGDPHRLLEASRDEWGWNWLDDAVQDFQQGFRALWRSPVFAATGMLILALGIGFNLTFFQIANVTLIQPRPVRSPDTLVRLYRHGPDFESGGVPHPASDFIRHENTVLSAVLTESRANVAWGATGAVSIDASFVSANWFAELGHGPWLGRVLAEDLDNRLEGTPGVVVSHAFWQRELRGDPAAVGAEATIDRQNVVIVGVARPDFPEFELGDTAVWIPVARREYFYPASDFLRNWKQNNTTIFGRLREGVSLAAARESLRGTMSALAREQPEHVAADEWLEPVSGSDNFLPARHRLELWLVLSLLAGLTLLVLVVAAANLGNLVLARATGRARELGIRIALGARRSRIVRQLLVETLPLALLGGLGAFVFAQWAATFIANIAGLPPYLDFSPNWRDVLASVLLAGLALMVVGALPAWKVAQQDLAIAIKDGGQQVTLRLDRTLLRRFMLSAQVACSCLLLAVAGMMARSAERAVTSDLGFEFESVALLYAPLPRYGLLGEAARAYWDMVAERVHANPETVDVALVTAPPFGGTVNRTGYNDAPGLKVLSQTVAASYFSVMQIPILAGRTFSPDDDPGGTAIISRRLALEMYGGMDVLGHGFPRSSPNRTIVGIVGDAHTIVVTATDVAEIYTPLSIDDYAGATLIARARTEASRLLPVLREAAALDARVIPTTRLMRDDFTRRTRPSRIVARVASGMGGLTLLLACLGIFGVISYSAALRKKEIGIHLSLGARRASILRLTTRSVLAPLSIGTAVGVMGAVPAGVVLSSEPFYLSPFEPAIYGIALTVFLIAAGTAAALPVLRVLRANPILALYHD